MPPKKKAANSDAADGGDKTFRWTPELDMKLMCLMTLPRSINAKDHAEISKALGVPTPGGVRNRVTKLKTDHRKAYEEAGIPMPGAAAVSKIAGKDEAKEFPKKSAAAKPGAKKRKANVEEDDDEEDMDIGIKKAKTEDDELESGLGGIGIKEEAVDDDDI